MKKPIKSKMASSLEESVFLERNRKRFDLILKSVKMQKQEWAIFKQIILLNCLLRLNWPIFVVSA